MLTPFPQTVTSILILLTISQKHLGRTNKGNDYQRKKLLIGKQILLVSTLGNV